MPSDRVIFSSHLGLTNFIDVANPIHPCLPSTKKFTTTNNAAIRPSNVIQMYLRGGATVNGRVSVAILIALFLCFPTNTWLALLTDQY